MKLLKKLKKQSSDETGAVLVMVALLMVVLLSITALAIDFGMGYYKKQQLQTACDAAALAGAQYLDQGNSVVEKYCKEYMEANGFTDADTDITVEIEGVGADKKVRVTGSLEVPTTFGRIMGFKQIDVAAHAAAKATMHTVDNGEFPYLLYGISESGNLNLGGNNYEINGAVHSNGTVTDAPNTGYVGQISFGTTLSTGGNYYFMYDDNPYVLYRRYSWGISKVDGNINMDEITANIDDYFLIPPAIYDASGNRQWWIQGIDWVNNNELYNNPTDHSSEKRARAISASGILSDILVNQQYLLDSDIPNVMITDLVSQAEDKIDNICSTVTTSFVTAVGDTLDVKDKTYINTTHLDSSVKITNLGDYYTNAMSGNVAITGNMYFVGSGKQYIDAQPSSAVSYRTSDLVFYNTDPSTSTVNGFSARNMTVQTGSVYSNSSLQIRNESGNANNFVINGNIYANGNIKLYHVTVNGNIFCTGNINAEGCNINGFIGAVGDIDFQGEKPNISSYSADNPNALSVYSRNGDISFVAGDATTPQYVAGVILAPNGNAQINSRMKFYGNVIGNTVTNISAELYAYPLSALENYESLNVLTPHGSGATTEINEIVLVE